MYVTSKDDTLRGNIYTEYYIYSKEYNVIYNIIIAHDRHNTSKMEIQVHKEKV